MCPGARATRRPTRTQQDERHEGSAEHHLPSRSNAAPDAKRARVTSVREAAGRHRAECGLVREPGGRARMDDERATCGAEASMRFHFPERSAARVANGAQRLVVVCGVVAGDLVYGPVADRQPGRVPKVERRSPGGARVAPDVESAADARRARPDALEQCPGPPAVHHALGDRECDYPAPRLAKAGSPERRDERPHRQCEYACGRQRLAREVRRRRRPRRPRPGSRRRYPRTQPAAPTGTLASFRRHPGCRRSR